MQLVTSQDLDSEYDWLPSESWLNDPLEPLDAIAQTEHILIPEQQNGSSGLGYQQDLLFTQTFETRNIGEEADYLFAQTDPPFSNIDSSHAFDISKMPCDVRMQDTESLNCPQFTSRKRRGESNTDDCGDREREQRFLAKRRKFEQEQLLTRYELLTNYLVAIKEVDMSDEQKLQASRVTNLSIPQIEAWLCLKQITANTASHTSGLLGMPDREALRTCSPRIIGEEDAHHARESTSSRNNSGGGVFGSTPRLLSPSPSMSSSPSISPFPSSGSSLAGSTPALIDDAQPDPVFDTLATNTFARQLHSTYDGNKVSCWLEMLSLEDISYGSDVSSSYDMAESSIHSYSTNEGPRGAGGRHGCPQEDPWTSRSSQASGLPDDRHAAIPFDQGKRLHTQPTTPFETSSMDSRSSVDSEFCIQTWASEPRQGRSKRNRVSTHQQVTLNPDSLRSPHPRGTEEKRTSGKFFCTYCHKNFEHAASWRRHELSVHTPLAVWLCKPLSSKVGAHEVCIACSQDNSNGDCEHLTRACWRQVWQKRVFTRADSLAQHLRGHHHIPADSTFTARFKEVLPPEAVRSYDMLCHINDCGCYFNTLQQRFLHIESHIATGCDRSCWNKAHVEHDMANDDEPQPLLPAKTCAHIASWRDRTVVPVPSSEPLETSVPPVFFAPEGGITSILEQLQSQFAFYKLPDLQLEETSWSSCHDSSG